MSGVETRDDVLAEDGGEAAGGGGCDGAPEYTLRAACIAIDADWAPLAAGAPPGGGGGGGGGVDRVGGRGAEDDGGGGGAVEGAVVVELFDAGGGGGGGGGGAETFRDAAGAGGGGGGLAAPGTGGGARGGGMSGADFVELIEIDEDGLCDGRGGGFRRLATNGLTAGWEGASDVGLGGGRWAGVLVIVGGLGAAPVGADGFEVWESER